MAERTGVQKVGSMVATMVAMTAETKEMEMVVMMVDQTVKMLAVKLG